MRERRIWGVIPVYNHAASLTAVALGVRRFLPGRVVVVDDGSEDWSGTLESVLTEAGIAVLHHARNRGKGAAILTAAKYLAARGADYMITLDADGQHDPEDIPAFLRILHEAPENDLVLVGCRDFSAATVPGSSRFGRKFSNFWFYLESGTTCADTQSGFRAYPVASLLKMRLVARHYNFEMEVLTRAVWGGLKIVDVPVSVYYPEAGKRVSHFHKFRDNLRISWVHIHLLTVRLLPLPQPDLTGGRKKVSLLSLFRHPGRFLRRLLHENASPAGLALAAAVGTLLAVLPLVACHMAVILYVTIRLRLNKVMALAVQNLFMPPLSPFLCMELGHFLRYGHFWTELTLASVTKELHHRLYEWLLGSLVLAPVFALIMGMTVYLAASALAGRMKR